MFSYRLDIAGHCLLIVDYKELKGVDLTVELILTKRLPIFSAKQEPSNELIIRDSQLFLRKFY